jgi:hypothetical protein
MNVSSVWFLYLIAILLTFVVLYFLVPKMKLEVKIFLSLLVGGLSVFLAGSCVTIDNDQLWLSILHVIAYILPLISGVYILWRDGYFTGKGLENSSNGCVITKEYTMVRGKPVVSKMTEVCS